MTIEQLMSAQQPNSDGFLAGITVSRKIECD